MSKLSMRYRQSSWHTAYNLSSDSGKARIALLLSCVPLAIVDGFTTGTFYSGLLVGYGINLVNISIISTIPNIASLLSFFTPYILKPFRKRRAVLSAAMIVYYLLNILGITLLPELVHDETGRIIGLIAIVFVANAFKSLFSGYSAWHMPYLVPEVRNVCHTANTLVTSIASSVVMLIAGAVVDAADGPMQLTIISTLRYISFAFSLLYVWLMQLPKEPEYAESSNRASLLDVLRKPMKDHAFRTTTLINCLSFAIANFTSGAYSAWLLEDIGVSYFYINLINSLFPAFIIGTYAFWNRFVRTRGKIKTYVIFLIIEGVAYILLSFISNSNYIWLMTISTLTLHAITLGQTFSLTNLYYENLPLKDQTAHTSFYDLTQHVSIFLGMSLGTWTLAIIDDHPIWLFGMNISGMPLLILLKALMYILLALFVLKVRRSLTPSGK